MMARKLGAILMAALLGMAPCAALAEDVTVDESVLLNGDEQIVDVPLESAPALDAVAQANTAAALLSTHTSLASYALTYSYTEGQTLERENMTALLNNGSGTTLYESNDMLAFVYDGDHRYLIYPDGAMGVNICFDGDINAYYDARIADFTLYSHHEGETLTACQRQGDAYILTSEIAHGAYSDATGQSFDLDDSTPIVTTLTVAADTLALRAWQIVARVAEGIDVSLSSGSVAYDGVTLPDQYFAMADPVATRTITIVSQPASAAASEQTFTIADGALPYVIAPGGYVITVMKNDQFVEPDEGDIPATGDLTLYLIPEAH